MASVSGDARDSGQFIQDECADVMLLRRRRSSVGMHPIANTQHNQHRNIFGLMLQLQHKTDAATNEHGDLLDLIRLHTGGSSLRHAMEEALAFLSLRQSTPANGGNRAGGYDREEAARRLWRRCRPIDGTHAEAYLHARAIGHCRFPALRFHPDLLHRDDNGIHRLPALVAAVTGDDGAVEGVQRTWLDPKRPTKANLTRPRKALGRVHGRAVRFGGSASGATLLAGEGIETVLSLVTAVPGIHAAAALSAGSLGAFEPPQDLALLVIARDKDVEGGHAANRLQRRCVERGIPSTVIVPEHAPILMTTSLPSEKKPLRPGSRPLLQAPSPRKRWKRGVGVGE